MNKLVNYQLLNKQLKGLLQDDKNGYSSLANFSAFIYQNLPDLNWAGFYLWSQQSQQLLLHAFQGKVACVAIESKKGVCGKAYFIKKTELVADVHKFPGHITCDSASESEIVLPLLIADQCYGVFDIDSPVLNRFSQADKIGLESLINTLVKIVDFTNLQK